MPTKLPILCYFIFSIFLVSGCEKKTHQAPDKITPTTQYPAPDINESTPQRVRDLIIIIYALERYKLDNKQYPISSNRGAGWDGLYAIYGVASQQWISGLVPEYLDRLPSDPRNNNSGNDQYLYKSNGANYKLVAHNPDDCAQIKERFPKLIDPTRDCWAYGFWTKKAGHW